MNPPSRPPPITAQLQQGERIIELAFTDQDAAETLAQLGLYTQGITLAQDANDVHLQREAVPVNEHERLYTDSYLNPIFYRSSLPPPHLPTQDSIARFFTPRQPIPNLPSSLPPRLRDAAPAAIPSPQATRSISAPSYSSITPAGSKDQIYADDDTEDEGDGFFDNEPNSPIYQENGMQGLSPTHAEGEERNDGEFEDERDGIDSNYTSQRGAGTESEEDSFHDFVSERSSPESRDDEPDTVELVADRLVDHLQNGFQGCTAGQHAHRLQEHYKSVGNNNHHGLNEIFNDPLFPSVLHLRDMISPERLAREPVLQVAQWQSMFCGVSPQHAPPAHPSHVCLHREETQAVSPQVAFDVDSFLSFAHSLSVAVQGMWYQPAPQMRRNMTKDVHLETTRFHYGNDPEQPLRPTPAMIRDVPHFLLGRVEGSHNMTIYVLFPHLGNATDRFRSLSDVDYTR